MYRQIDPWETVEPVPYAAFGATAQISPNPPPSPTPTPGSPTPPPKPPPEVDEPIGGG